MTKKKQKHGAWRAKLYKDQDPKIVKTPPKMQKRYGKGTMLIPKPLDVDTVIRTVKKGKLITQEQIRNKLAKEYKADTSCPLCVGIFVRISAEAAEEDIIDNQKRITPYWRVLKADGSLNDKFPGGSKSQAKKLQDEGHSFIKQKGKKPPKVKDFEKALVKM